MMLSESLGNQKSMWTKLPAALKWITAVHHSTLDDTLHQLKTRSFSGITYSFCSIQKCCIKWEKTVSHARHIISMHCTRHKLCLYCAFAVFFFSWIEELYSGKAQLLHENTEYRSGQGTASFSELDVRPRTATSNNGPRLWRCLRSKEEFNWTTAFFGFYKRIFWKDNSQCSTSQIWTVWESGQMA